ncbi:hypothetical protein AOLI_G00119210 [Acnodon oligacanthus]
MRRSALLQCSRLVALTDPGSAERVRMALAAFTGKPISTLVLEIQGIIAEDRENNSTYLHSPLPSTISLQKRDIVGKLSPHIDQQWKGTRHGHLVYSPTLPNARFLTDFSAFLPGPNVGLEILMSRRLSETQPAPRSSASRTVKGALTPPVEQGAPSPDRRIGTEERRFSGRPSRAAPVRRSKAEAAVQRRHVQSRTPSNTARTGAPAGTRNGETVYSANYGYIIDDFPKDARRGASAGKPSREAALRRKASRLVACDFTSAGRSE